MLVEKINRKMFLALLYSLHIRLKMEGKLMTLTNREKILLIILIFVIVTGSFLYFLLLPMMDKIKENSKVLEHDRIVLSNLEQANKTGVLTDKEKNIQNEIKRIEAILPTQVKIPEIFLEIL